MSFPARTAPAAVIVAGRHEEVSGHGVFSPANPASWSLASRDPDRDVTSRRLGDDVDSLEGQTIEPRSHR